MRLRLGNILIHHFTVALRREAYGFVRSCRAIATEVL
jgi:hypothetical protein